jgi:putative sterol carrier protein
VFTSGQQVTTHHVLTDRGREFYMCFEGGAVTGALGSLPAPAEVRLEMAADMLDGMFTGRVNAARAAMSEKISFDGDTRQALGIRRIQKDLNRLYNLARAEVTVHEA